jgi:hypothetical protein
MTARIPSILLLMAGAAMGLMAFFAAQGQRDDGAIYLDSPSMADVQQIDRALTAVEASRTAGAARIERVSVRRKPNQDLFYVKLRNRGTLDYVKLVVTGYSHGQPTVVPQIFDVSGATVLGPKPPLVWKVPLAPGQTKTVRFDAKKDSGYTGYCVLPGGMPPSCAYLY